MVTLAIIRLYNFITTTTFFRIAVKVSIPSVLSPSSSASLLSCSFPLSCPASRPPSCLPRACPEYTLSCIHPVLPSSCPVSILSCLPLTCLSPILPLSYPASLLSCLLVYLYLYEIQNKIKINGGEKFVKFIKVVNSLYIHISKSADFQ